MLLVQLRGRRVLRRFNHQLHARSKCGLACKVLADGTLGLNNDTGDVVLGSTTTTGHVVSAGGGDQFVRSLNIEALFVSGAFLFSAGNGAARSRVLHEGQEAPVPHNDNDSLPKVDRRGNTLLVPLGFAAVFLILVGLMFMRTEDTAPTPPPPSQTTPNR